MWMVIRTTDEYIHYINLDRIGAIQIRPLKFGGPDIEMTIYQFSGNLIIKGSDVAHIHFTHDPTDAEDDFWVMLNEVRDRAKAEKEEP